MPPNIPSSYLNCDHLVGILEEHTRTWQDHVREITGVPVTDVFGDRDRLPELVRLSDGNYASMWIVGFAWNQEQREKEEKEAEIQKLLTGCRGIIETTVTLVESEPLVFRQCGKTTLESL